MKIKKDDVINELSLPSIDGSVFDLENIKGKKALISFIDIRLVQFVI